MSVYQRLESLSIKLPAVAPPVAALVPFVRSGWLVFLSGHSSARGRSIYTETIQAFNLGAPTLAEAGLRAIVEALCIHQGASGNLQKKIDSLVERGLLAKPKNLEAKAANKRTVADAESDS